MSTTTTSKGWNIALWIVQVILAAMFLMAGFTKITKTEADLAAMMPWTEAVPLLMVRFIGTAEFLGAVGLLLPSLLRIKPVLTPVAASGLVLVMTLAAVFHISRGEFGAIGFNLMLALLAGLVAWGRFKKAPLATR
jgi:putative oxidoreductase